MNLELGKDGAAEAARKAEAAVLLRDVVDGDCEALKSNEPRSCDEAGLKDRQQRPAKAQDHLSTNSPAFSSGNADPLAIPEAEYEAAQRLTNGAGDKGFSEAARAEITGLASATSLSKRITLGADGELAKGPPRHFGVGKAQRLRAGTAKELAARINKCRPTQAFLYARLKEGIVDPADMTIKGNEAGDAISRSKDFFEFANGPGWILADVDDGGAAALDAIYAVVPELKTTARVVRASTSSGIYNADTFEQFAASLGLHASFLLADQSDAPRFLDDLHKRLWLADYGWIKLSAAGTMLERSPVDLAMKNPVQPIFEGAPDLGPGLLQMPRPAVAHEGEPLDSRACPPLTKAEMKEYARRVQEAKTEKAAEADRVRAEWVGARRLSARWARRHGRRCQGQRPHWSRRRVSAHPRHADGLGRRENGARRRFREMGREGQS